MSGENMNEIQAQVNEQGQRLAVVENSTAAVLNKMDKLIDSNVHLSTQFAKYCVKHDNTEKILAKYGTKIDEHGDFISATKPFIEGLRGIVWKIIAGVAVASGSVQGLLMVLETASKTS